MLQDTNMDLPGLPTYYGGKGSPGTVRRIINCFPPHDIYIEAFLGSGRLYRTKRPSVLGRDLGVELDPALCALWAAVPTAKVIRGDALAVVPELVSAAIAEGIDPARILVYCDPPYLIHTRKSQRGRYACEFDTDDHVRFLDMVRALTCRVVVSHLPCPEYATALGSWHTFTFDNVTHGGLQLEQVWCNYQPGTLHEWTYVGDNFRQREQFKRKFASLFRILDKLPPNAHEAFVAMMQARR